MDVNGLEHFVGVHIPVAPNRGRVDVLIAQSVLFLTVLEAVLEKREGVDLEETNYVLTRLGPIAIAERAGENSYFLGLLSAPKVNVDFSAEDDYNKLRRKCCY